MTMLTNRLNGIDPLSRFSAEVDRVFHDVLDRFAEGASWEPRTRLAFPPVNLWEDEQSLYLEAEVPGCDVDDLEITVSGRMLTLKGERKAPFASRAYQRQERGIGRFTRELELPFAIEDGSVQAQLSHGVLTVTLPKAAEARPRKIAVQSTETGSQARITTESPSSQKTQKEVQS